MRNTILFFLLCLTLSACKKENEMLEMEEIDPCETVETKGQPTLLWQKNIAASKGADYIYSIKPIKYGDNYIVSQSIFSNSTFSLINGETGAVIWKKELDNYHYLKLPVFLEGDKLFWNNLDYIVELDLITLAERKIVTPSNSLSEMSVIDYPNYIFNERELNVNNGIHVEHLKVLDLETEEVETIYTDTLFVDSPNSFDQYSLFYPRLWKNNGRNLVSFLRLKDEEYPYDQFDFLTIDFDTKAVIAESPVSQVLLKYVSYAPEHNYFLLNFEYKTVAVDGLTGEIQWEINPLQHSMQTDVLHQSEVGEQFLTSSYNTLRLANSKTGELEDTFLHLPGGFIQLQNSVWLPDSEEILILYSQGIASINHQTGCMSMQFSGEDLGDGHYDGIVFYYDEERKKLLVGKGTDLFCLDMSAF